MMQSNQLTAVRVRDIILDIEHPLADKFGHYDAIGTIFYQKLDGPPPSENTALDFTAVPLFSHVKYYPLINEIVLIMTTYDKQIYEGKQSQTYYFPQINIWGHPHHNALPSISSLESSQDYTNSNIGENLGGIVRRVKDGSTDITLGVYFKEQLNIKPLLPYEGDMILEGRFGNSIRFGSTNYDEFISDVNLWSDGGNTGDPITIIRNGQNSEAGNEGWIPTTEDINGDASSIYLTSNQRIQNFIPASPYRESWGAKYILPPTLEEALLNPAGLENLEEGILSLFVVDPITGLPGGEIALPPDNEDPTITLPVVVSVEEEYEIDEIVDNPQAANEVEPDQIGPTNFNPIGNINHLQNPGDVEGSGGATIGFDTSGGEAAGVANSIVIDPDNLTDDKPGIDHTP